jgi:hypothetical protein
MSLFIGNLSRCREIAPPRQYEVLTGRAYLKTLENGEISNWQQRATFTLDEASGQVAIQSQYGDYAYCWRSIGSDSLAEFLCSLDLDYFMTKAAAKPWQELDFEATIAALKRGIIDSRREMSLEKETARDGWEALERIDEDECRSTSQFYAALGREFSGQSGEAIDLYDLPIIERIRPEVEAFWNIVMPPFRAHIAKLSELEKSRLDLAKS